MAKKCATCRERAVSALVLSEHATELEHDGRKYSVVIRNFPVLRCERCGTLVFDDEANDRLTEALRWAAKLLLPAEIRSERERLKLTQKKLADLLHISESTLSRWETGSQIQQRCMDQLLRGFFSVEEFRRFLGGPESPPISQVAQPRAVTSPTQAVSFLLPLEFHQSLEGGTPFQTSNGSNRERRLAG